MSASSRRGRDDPLADLAEGRPHGFMLARCRTPDVRAGNDPPGVSRRPPERSTTCLSKSPRLSGWAVGGITFAATMMTMIGIFQIIATVAIFDDGFYVITENYTFDLDTTGWGWIHLLLGLLLVLAGYGLFAGAAWAVATAIVLAVLSAVANFFHPVLPVLVAHHRARRLGDLGATRPGAVDRA